MTETAAYNSNLVARAQNILFKPAEEWVRIDAEPDTIGRIYKGYVLPLAAIPALAGLIGALAFGHSFLGVTYRPSLAGTLTGAVVQYGLALAGVYVLALIIDALAPTFQSERNRVQAFKVAAYSATASWLAGVFAILPSLAWLSILGLYSLYLFRLGLPRLMRTPEAKAWPYIGTVVLAAVVLTMVIGAVTGPISGLAGRQIASASRDGTVSGTLHVPGMGSVDLDKLQSASRQMEAGTQSMQDKAAGRNTSQGKESVTAVEPAVLQALLPQTLGTLERTEVQSFSAGNASTAEGRYGGGATTATLQIKDLAAMSSLMALGAAFGGERVRQTKTGYEKSGKVDGRMMRETWDDRSRRGRYSLFVADRFQVQASGRGVDMAELRDAVAAVDMDALEKLARQ